MIAIITIIGTLAGSVTAVYAAWPIIGWTTPSQHQSDIDEAVGGIQEFRDEWKCDEYSEELLDLLKQQRAGDDSVETEERIKRLRDKMKKLDCDRFED
jgi:hypothetical protein